MYNNFFRHAKMSNKQNQYIIDLLYNNPYKLLEEMQPVIHKTVHFFILRKQLQKDLHEEIVQSINEKLLTQKLSIIQGQYNRSVKFLTYFTKIIINMCKEYLRAETVQKKHIIRREIIESTAIIKEKEIINNLIIKEEAQRLNYFLRLFVKEYPKLIVGLKLYIRYPISIIEIENRMSTKISDIYPEVKVFLESDYPNVHDREIYDILVRIFNLNREKNVTPDSVRKWIISRMDRLIKILNKRRSEYGTTCYNRETFKLLLQKSFEKSDEEQLETSNLIIETHNKKIR